MYILVGLEHIEKVFIREIIKADVGRLGVIEVTFTIRFIPRVFI